MGHFIYVIGPADGPVKIGHSADPERRRRQLQTAQPEPLFLRHSEPVDPSRAGVVEHLIHRSMGHLRVRGEWFDVSVEDAVLAVQWGVIRFEDNPLSR